MMKEFWVNVENIYGIKLNTNKLIFLSDLKDLNHSEQATHGIGDLLDDVQLAEEVQIGVLWDVQWSQLSCGEPAWVTDKIVAQAGEGIRQTGEQTGMAWLDIKHLFGPQWKFTVGSIWNRKGSGSPKSDPCKRKVTLQCKARVCHRHVTSWYNKKGKHRGWHMVKCNESLFEFFTIKLRMTLTFRMGQGQM